MNDQDINRIDNFSSNLQNIEDSYNLTKQLHDQHKVQIGLEKLGIGLPLSSQILSSSLKSKGGQALLSWIKNKIPAGDDIKDTANDFLTGNEEAIPNLINRVDGKLNSAYQYLSDKVGAIKDKITGVKNDLESGVENARNNIYENVDNLRSNVSNNINNARNSIYENVDNLRQPIQMDELTDNLNNRIQSVGDKWDNDPFQAQTLIDMKKGNLDRDFENEVQPFDNAEQLGQPDSIYIEPDSLGGDVEPTNQHLTSEFIPRSEDNIEMSEGANASRNVFNDPDIQPASNFEDNQLISDRLDVSKNEGTEMDLMKPANQEDKQFDLYEKPEDTISNSESFSSAKSTLGDTADVGGDAVDLGADLGTTGAELGAEGAVEGLGLSGLLGPVGAVAGLALAGYSLYEGLDDLFSNDDDKPIQLPNRPSYQVGL